MVYNAMLNPTKNKIKGWNILIDLSKLDKCSENGGDLIMRLIQPFYKNDT